MNGDCARGYTLLKAYGQISYGEGGPSVLRSIRTEWVARTCCAKIGSRIKPTAVVLDWLPVQSEKSSSEYRLGAQRLLWHLVNTDFYQKL